MSDLDRIELEIEVPGTAEIVWSAIATGPGIGSWYVPHTLEPRTGGALVASFGSAEEMQAHGTVSCWEPPSRFAYAGSDAMGSLSFEWTVSQISEDVCRVGLVNSGFGSDADSQAHRAAMRGGWGMFLNNLALHLEHFAGRTAASALPMSVWNGAATEIWTAVLNLLGLQSVPSVGDRIDTIDRTAPSVTGSVAEIGQHHLMMVLESPAPATGFITVEGHGTEHAVSAWWYFYGEERAEIAATQHAAWQSWLDERAQERTSATT